MRNRQLISFFEVDADREARLGSGTPIEVKLRRPPAPFLRVLQLDSSADGIGLRSRFGRLRVDDEGVHEVEELDMMVFRGSSAEVFFVLPAIAYALDLNKADLLKTFGDIWDFHWFRYTYPFKVKRIDVDRADVMLSPGGARPSSFVLHFAGTAAQFSAMVEALSPLKRPLTLPLGKASAKTR